MFRYCSNSVERTEVSKMDKDKVLVKDVVSPVFQMKEDFLLTKLS